MQAIRKDQFNAHTEFKKLKAGERLFSTGDSAESMFIVTQGTMSVISDIGTTREIAQLKKGETFGERAYISKGGYKRQFSVFAKTDAVVLEITRENLPSIEKVIPDLSEKIINTLLQRLERAEKMISVLVPTDEKKRIAVALLCFSGPNDDLCEVNADGTLNFMSPDQIQDLTALDANSVLGFIEELLKKQIIGKRENHYFIMNESELRRFGNLS